RPLSSSSFSRSILAACYPYCYYHSSPTRRSSDLLAAVSESAETAETDTAGSSSAAATATTTATATRTSADDPEDTEVPAEDAAADRKSTRLNSSHVSISYAVFCSKKKNTAESVYS